MAHRFLVAAVLALALPIPLTTAAAAPPGGSAWAWGLNADGELGNGTVTPYSGLSTPVQAANLSQVVSVTGGDQHSLALKSDGTVWACGNAGWGQRGNGTYAP